MELRLQKLIESVERLADIRNQDIVNPVMFTFPHPDPQVGTEHVMVASIAEPNYLSLPINGVWIVMNPDHAYYRQALQLRSYDAPSVEYRGAISGLDSTWVQITRYDRAFDPQHWLDAGGAGPKGPRGDLGLIWAGAWNDGRAYKVGEAVRHLGASYLALRPSTGVDPATRGDNWLLIAEVGKQPVIDYAYLVQRVAEGLGWTTTPQE